MFYAVVMAGGQGTRLWPMSRKSQPKQLQKLASDKTLIRETVDRILPIFKPTQIIISTTPEYALIIREILPEIPEENYILEPFANNTAAACGLINTILHQRDKDAVLAIIYSDHSVKNTKAFCQTLRGAEKLIQDHHDHIVTVGITPSRPDTGLGYIQKEEALKGVTDAYKVKRFVEKPDLENARAYLKSGQYLWNTGMFVWQAAHYRSLMNKHMPDTQKVLDEIVAKSGQSDYEQFLSKNYGRTKNTSIDYGIMEKTNDILVIQADFGWSDIGNWGALFDLLSEIHDTSLISRGEHISHGDENSLIIGGDKLIATVGLKDVIVVDTPDAILICNRHEAHKVKEIIAKLKEEGKEKYL